jgi:choline dehydrogenase-like flavoprotein
MDKNKEREHHFMTVVASSPAGAEKSLVAGWLTPGEFATVEAICDTLLPSLDPPPRSFEAVAAYYRRCAADLQIAERIAEVLSRESPTVQGNLRRFLTLFTSGLVSLLLVGRARPFVALSQAEREAFLGALANSPIGIFRQGFQGMKRLAGLLYFSIRDKQGINPNWTILDYIPPSPRPAQVSASITPLAITGPTTLEADAVIIGSGAGGGVVAAELAQAGKSVIVLEKGGYHHEGTFTQQESEALKDLFLKRGTLATRDLGVLLMAGNTLGGGTVINWMTCLRTPDDVLAEWDHRSGLPGYFTGPQLQQSFSAVERRLSVNREHSQLNRQNQILFNGARALGYHAERVPRNAVGCEQRCGACNFGCRYGCSQSTLKTYLQDAYDHGACIVVHASAQKVLVEHKQVTGVIASVRNVQTGISSNVTIRAKVVIVSAGALQTPAILLRSGIANKHIGRHLYLHPTAVSVGDYAEKVYAWQGVLQSVYSEQFAHLDGNYGYRLEVAPTHPGLFGLATPWHSARDYREQSARNAHLSSIIVLTRDRGEGRVRVDRAGEPIVEYVVAPYDRQHLLHGLGQGARIHLAAGAQRVISLQNKPTYLHASVQRTEHEEQVQAYERKIKKHGLEANRIVLFSAHQMGTCRMGADPRSAVIDGHQQVHGVKGLFVCDSSVFPTACGVNPMLSIMALAHKASKYIKTTL